MTPDIGTDITSTSSQKDFNLKKKIEKILVLVMLSCDWLNVSLVTML